ncbi:MAG TPA: hypothetical protein VI603_02640 [Saprospiraceae bacterium]|nr:hypothetical protein [Saprospiraceae bacterium]
MRSPFKFLDAFTVQDKNVFFGRDNEIESLYSLVFKTNLLIVYGLSGTGKTSVIQCGLASRFDGPDWYPMFIRRNENLNTSLATAMLTTLGDDTKEDLVANVSYLMRKTLRPVYLILDQFEELFILGSHQEQETFMQSLRNLLDAGLNAKIILVMREEYIGQLYPYEQIIPELFDFRFRVEPMGITKVQSVIQDSFDKFNIYLEEPKREMLQYMTDQISDPKSGIALPYLQVYLDMLYRETYRKKYGKEGTQEALPRLDITKEDIASLGRIGNVLDKFLTQQSAELTETMQKEYPSFPSNGIQLVLDPFATDEGTKRPVHYVRKGEKIELDALVNKAMPDLPEGSLSRSIELLEHARILRMREDTIELAHDSLAAIVDQKRTDEQRQLQNIRRRLSNAFEEFQKTGLYLNDKQLAAFDEYLPKLRLNDELQKFIQESESDIVRKAQTERNRQQQEHEAKQQRKLARTRGILLTVVGIFAGAAALFAVFAQRNYNKADIALIELGKKSELLQAQVDTTRHQQDSIQNILTQVDQQLSRMDSVINGYFPDYQIEIQKTVITLKSLVSNDTMSSQELVEQFASVKDFITTSAIQNKSEPGPPGNDFSLGQEVYVFANVLVKKPKELLQIKWFGPDAIIIGNPTYVEVKRSNSDTIPMFMSSKFGNPGIHEVRLYNSAGREIGATKFSIRAEKPSELSVKPENFKIVSSVIDNKPGKETSRFRTGSTIYYWGRVHCPLASESVIVQITDPDGRPWETKHQIGMNMNTGYMIWSAKGFRISGTYVARVLDSQGVELARKEFVME